MVKIMENHIKMDDLGGVPLFLVQHPHVLSIFRPAAMFTTFRCFTDGCSAYDGTPLQERIRVFAARNIQKRS